MPSVLTLPLGATVMQPVAFSGNPSLLSQILQGVQAGSLAITSYYQGQAAINQAKAEAAAAGQMNYGQYQPNTVTGAVSGSTDMTPFLLAGGALLLFMMMDKK